MVKRENNFSKTARSKCTRSVPMERESFLRKSRIPYSFAEGVTIGLRVSAVKMKGRIA